MREFMTPLSLLITGLAAWLNERNNETIDFLGKNEVIGRTQPLG